MILFCEVGDERAFFERAWCHLADDIQYRYRQTIGDISYRIPDTELRDSLLDELAVLFGNSGHNIRECNLPQRSNASSSLSTNRLIDEELSYCPTNFTGPSDLLSSLNPGQLHAFTSIVDRVLNNEPGFFFVSDYGGTGKTYLWSSIMTFLRAQGKIVLAVASSGVASLLLAGGRTAHSCFKIPCDLDDSSVYEIRRGTMLAKLIETASLII